MPSPSPNHTKRRTGRTRAEPPIATGRAQSSDRSASPAATVRPIIFLVSGDRSTLRALERDLSARFGNDTQVMAADRPTTALARLAASADGAQPVALLLADETMP